MWYTAKLPLSDVGGIQLPILQVAIKSFFKIKCLFQDHVLAHSKASINPHGNKQVGSLKFKVSFMFLSVHSPSLLTKFAEQVTQGDGDGVKGTRKSINTCSTSHMRHVTQQLQPETSPIKTNQLHRVSPRDLSVVRVRGVRDRTEFAGGGGIISCVCVWSLQSPLPRFRSFFPPTL